MTNRQVLLLIAAFITVTLGMFIWYIATWDSDARTSTEISDAPIFILVQKLPVAVDAPLVRAEMATASARSRGTPL